MPCSGGGGLCLCTAQLRSVRLVNGACSGCGHSFCDHCDRCSRSAAEGEEAVERAVPCDRPCCRAVATVLEVQHVCCYKEVPLVAEALTAVGVAEEDVHVNVANKTVLVRHFADLESGLLAEALNAQLLGARVLSSGGCAAEPGGHRRIQEMLADADSALCRAVLVTQILLFAAGSCLPTPGAEATFLLVAALSHSLLRRSWQALRSCRFKVQVLMLLAMVGAVANADFPEAALVGLVVGVTEWVLARVDRAVRQAMEQDLPGKATHALRLTEEPSDSGRDLEAASDPVGAGASGGLVPIQNLNPGDLVWVKAGEAVPVDGQIRHSEGCFVDESWVSGEALPIVKAAGDCVFSGTVFVQGTALLECVAPAAESFQGQMRLALEEAQGGGSNLQETVTTVAGVYTPLVFIFALAVGLVTQSGHRALVALISACPCALVAAAPVLQACAILRLLGQHRVLVKSGQALESLGDLGFLACDKTGTLTEGQFAIADIWTLPAAQQLERRSLLRLLAALEARDSHPIANSIVHAYAGCCADFAALGAAAALPAPSAFRRGAAADVGAGVCGVVEGRRVAAGNQRWLEAEGVPLPPEAAELLSQWHEEYGAHTAVFMALDGEFAMALCLQDRLRPDAESTMRELTGDLGVEVAILTGDEQASASSVARRLGIDEVYPAMNPQEKQAWVEARIQNNARIPRRSARDGARSVRSPRRVPRLLGGKVCNPRTAVGFLGDGLNDAPALAAADVGIALAGGLQLPVEAADVVVAAKGDDALLRLLDALRFSRRARGALLQGIGLAIALNGVSLVLAAFGRLSCSEAIVLDALGLALVTLNGLRPLAWHRLPRPPGRDPELPSRAVATPAADLMPPPSLVPAPEKFEFAAKVKAMLAAGDAPAGEAAVGGKPLGARPEPSPKAAARAATRAAARSPSVVHVHEEAEFALEPPESAEAQPSLEDAEAPPLFEVAPPPPAGNIPRHQRCPRPRLASGFAPRRYRVLGQACDCCPGTTPKANAKFEAMLATGDAPAGAAPGVGGGGPQASPLRGDYFDVL